MQPTLHKDMHLESWNFKYVGKQVEGNVVSMKLTKQESKSKCTLGKSFGFKGDIVWVDKGARGWFRIEYSISKPEVQPAPAIGM